MIAKYIFKVQPQEITYSLSSLGQKGIEERKERGEGEGSSFFSLPPTLFPFPNHLGIIAHGNRMPERFTYSLRTLRQTEWIYTDFAVREKKMDE
jgi:hypothetical protein